MAGFLTDRAGRWRTIVLTDLTFILGGAVLAAAPDTGDVGYYIVFLVAGPISSLTLLLVLAISSSATRRPPESVSTT